MLTELVLDVPVAPWRDLGFVTAPHSDHQHTVIAGVRFVFSGAGSQGLTGWGFDSVSESVESIDGIPTTITAVPNEKFDHPLDVASIDHVVVMTPSLDRTCGAIETSLGLPLKRIREVGGGVRQGFHRAESVILEVVERPDIAEAEPARLWGVVFVVNDLDELATRLRADVLGPVKDAVQPGRKIATVAKGAGLGVPVAFMTP